MNTKRLLCLPFVFLRDFCWVAFVFALLGAFIYPTLLWIFIHNFYARFTSKDYDDYLTQVLTGNLLHVEVVNFIANLTIPLWLPFVTTWLYYKTGEMI